MKQVLPVIILSQFFCTSVWFAGNAILPDIIASLHLVPGFLAHLTSSVQFGFISGTFIFAVLTISDRFSPSRVFFISSLLAAACNFAISINHITPVILLLSRFLTGFFLAGIYPVGMKLASDHYREGLGKSLGLLVGALVLGTAFPHLLKSIAVPFSWTFVANATSALSVVGGLIILLFVPDGPYRRQGTKMKFTSFLGGFRNRNFRTVAFGYFGHMWELYTFWAFVPVMLTAYKTRHPETHANVPFLAFLIIASGSIACAISGLLSQRIGAKKIATICLCISCICCLLSPLLLYTSYYAVITFLFFWGMVVVADSPMFSTLVAGSAPAESRGSSLTIINCIGFSITIISIQFINALSGSIDPRFIYMILAIGPILGIVALLSKKKQQ